jgi:hypothetical protein
MSRKNKIKFFKNSLLSFDIAGAIKTYRDEIEG